MGSTTSITHSLTTALTEEDSVKARCMLLTKQAERLEAAVMAFRNEVEELRRSLGSRNTTGPEAQTRLKDPIRKRAESANSVSNDPIYLRPLAKRDYLRTKWKLGKGLPSAMTATQEIPMLPPRADDLRSVTGHLKLSGMLLDGQNWESVTALSQIAVSQGAIIGRDSAVCLIRVPDSGVSRQHAKLFYSAQGLTIQDLGSKNGLSVNGVALTPEDAPRHLSRGDIIDLGDVSLLVDMTA
ncbi:FHA domain-containing protein [Akkermansia glycaniphila]|uniref:FHA domain-containing protein n=1 Tax=Akkermansia glycaniphila TaxID=1679444 RepID=UPI001C012E94|nr:FHA domain-containing protein [Akkermansia glycaniphila]MBT9450042.1 FHA domain-containing protein [Akkermansia glycaniphila]